MHYLRNASIIRRVGLSALVVAALAFPPAAMGAGIIDFDQSTPINQTGVISYNGGGIGVGTISGVGILFDTIKGVGTPFNNGEQLSCAACTLNFTSGVVTSITNIAGNTFITFGAGGSMSMTAVGGVAANAGTPAHPGSGAGTVLATGSWTQMTLTIFSNGLFNVSGFGLDNKETNLVEYFYGLGSNNPPLQFNSSTTEFGGTGVLGPGGSFTSTGLTLADFANTVPEPGTTALLMLGLSFVAARRRKS